MSFLVAGACDGSETIAPDTTADDAGASGTGGSSGMANQGGLGSVGSGGVATSGSGGGAGSNGGTGSGGAGGRAGGSGGTGGTSGGSAGAGGSSGASGSAGAGGSSGVSAYSTDFNLTESPISEGGKWKHAGLDWTNVITAGGLAFGTQNGNGGFDDSYAYLAASFPANQSASGTIHLEAGITAAYAEVEILLRWTDSTHNSTGYECNLAYNGQYAEIIKWPGPLGTQKSQFKFISSGNAVAGGVHEGDVFQADVIGNVITSRLNGKVIATGMDSSIPSGGAPGIGFYSEGAPASPKFSFTQFSAKGL
jgi:hypothetical protein